MGFNSFNEGFSIDLSSKFWKQTWTHHAILEDNLFFQEKTLVRTQAAQAHHLWVRASEVIWSEYTRIISVLSDAK